ncbi:hypothetical protein [Saccharothrix sp.]|uniref:hypothetical protein n=1 Tax=Saccharothrix sp. TaxID=1873460 RepID=UPI0028119B4E|nr:hypothetical protein [Saccharothrix sp.]
MFRLSPPTPVGGLERTLPRPSPVWVVVVLMFGTGWETAQPAVLLGALAMLVLLTLNTTLAPHGA